MNQKKSLSKGSVAICCFGLALLPIAAFANAIPTETWGQPLAATSKPADFVGAVPGHTQFSALVYDPNPGSTTIQYSSFADVPGTDAALMNLSENLGKDPVRIYEWVRNNVRTEFYYGCHRGAYLTLLERAGNDVDQCALLGALFRAAGYSPLYRLELIKVPRTATNTNGNQVGAYDWLGVTDDAGALSMVSLLPYTTFDGDQLVVPQMWVSIPIAGHEVKFAPSIKPQSVGRRPDLDALSGYTLADAQQQAGATVSGWHSPAISSSGLRTYLNLRTTQASEAIRTSSSLHDLDGPELARLPVIVPQLVSITAATASRYPDNIVFPDNALTLPLEGIPQSYCAHFKVQAGSVERNFECPELLGKSLAVEFDDSGVAYVRYGGADIGHDSSGGATDSITIQLTYEYPIAFRGGQSYTVPGTRSMVRQHAVAIPYAFGATQGRLQKMQQEVAANEVNAVGVSATDRIQIIGEQYVSQVNELLQIAAGSLDHSTIRQIIAGFVYLPGNNPILDVPINTRLHVRRSALSPDSVTTAETLDLMMGALEGTAIEQMSGQRSYGTPTLLDAAGRDAYLIQSTTDLASAGLVNFGDSIIGLGTNTAVTNLLGAGGSVLVLGDSLVSVGSVNFSGYYQIYASSTPGVATIMGGALGGKSPQPVGTPAVAPKVNANPTTGTANNETTPKTASSDPVDLSNGAFLREDIDLTAGASEPSGLRLERSYNSAMRLSNPVGLGYGWTHNYDRRLTTRAPSDFSVVRSSYDEVLPVVLAARLIQDALHSENSARSWLLATTAVTWAVDQQLQTRASITMGDSTMEFIKRPDGSFRGPGSVTATLSLQSDGYDLTLRLGNTTHFRGSDGRFTSITDPFGNQLTATYNTDGSLHTVTDAYTRVFTFTYNSGRLVQVSDGVRSVYYNVAADHLTFTDAEGKVQKYEMDPDHLVTRLYDGRGRVVVENDYDSWKQVWRQRTFGEQERTAYIKVNPGIGTEIDPLLNEVRTYYDTRGRKIFVVDQDGHFATWQYDGADRLVKAITAKGFETSYGYDYNHVLISQTNPAGDTRTITPDGLGRPLDVRNFENQKTTYEYWNTTSDRVKTITAPGGIVTSFTYDTIGRTQSQHPAVYAAGKSITYAYDGNGNLQKITYPDASHDDYVYTARGDLTQFTDRNLVKTTYDYNNRRQQISTSLWNGATAYTSQIFYDDAGNIDYTIDASGRKVDSDHDALGHLTEVRKGNAQVITVANSYLDPRNLLSSSTDAMGNSINYGYYATQQLATVVDPLARTTSYFYDEDQRPTSTRSPLGGAAWLANDPDYASTTIWDSRGFKEGLKDAEGNESLYTYDKDGRPKGISNRLSNDFSWAYDDVNRTVTTHTPLLKPTVSSNNSRGLPASLIEPSGDTTTYDDYDDEGRLLQKTNGLDVANRTVTTFTYWSNGLPKNVSEVVTVNSVSTTYTTTRTYDAINRLASYADGEGNTIEYDYYPSGELKKIGYPGNKAVTYDYDDFGRLWHVTDWANRKTTYTYDDASRLIRMDRPNNTYRLQEYDEASQLRFIKEYKSDGSLITFQEIKYDDDGRLTSSFVNPKPPAVGVPQDDLAYDHDNRLMTWNTQNVTFDDDGNMTNGPLPSGSFATYVYDQRNRMTSAGGMGYRYNPDGLRVEITGTDAATFVIDPNAKLSRTLIRSKNGITTYYVYGLGLIYEETGTATKTYHCDQVGSTLAITADDQAVIDRWSYAPYGAIVSRTGTTDTPFQFNGELGVQTDTNGLYYMRARFYNPRLMRFCNADPMKFDAGLNWYAYSSNSPFSAVDPLGLCAQSYWTGQYWTDVFNYASDYSLGVIESPLSLAQGISSGYAQIGGLAAEATTGEFWNDVGRMGSHPVSTAASTVQVGVEVVVNTAESFQDGRNLGNFTGGFAVGSYGLPGALSQLSNASKGTIGEATSLLKNLAQGNIPAGGDGVGWQVEVQVGGRTPILDWQFRNIFTGDTTYVESKFGTSNLSSAQRAAASNLSNMTVEKWTYDFWSKAGAAGGAAGATAGSGRKP